MSDTHDLPVTRLVKSVEALLASLAHDDQGTMIGGHYQGGNGGLISPGTVALADEVRRALNALACLNGRSSPTP